MVTFVILGRLHLFDFFFSSDHLHDEVLEHSQSIIGLYFFDFLNIFNLNSLTIGTSLDHLLQLSYLTSLFNHDIMLPSNGILFFVQLLVMSLLLLLHGFIQQFVNFSSSIRFLNMMLVEGEGFTDLLESGGFFR